MKLSSFDAICLGGSLVLAASCFVMTGDLAFAERLGLAFMQSWALMQAARFCLGIWHLPDSTEG